MYKAGHANQGEYVNGKTVRADFESVALVPECAILAAHPFGLR
jgi:hypothetical protein